MVLYFKLGVNPVCRISIQERVRVDEKIQRALARDRTIDITTIGRKTQKPRRIEIWFHNLGGHIYLTGLPGKRSWYANLLANPEFTFHLKGSVKADLQARATPVQDAYQRREILGQILPDLIKEGNLEEWVDSSPLVEVKFKTG